MEKGASVSGVLTQRAEPSVSALRIQRTCSGETGTCSRDRRLSAQDAVVQAGLEALAGGEMEQEAGKQGLPGLI